MLLLLFAHLALAQPPDRPPTQATLRAEVLVATLRAGVPPRDLRRPIRELRHLPETAWEDSEARDMLCKLHDAIRASHQAPPERWVRRLRLPDPGPCPDPASRDTSDAD